MNNNNLAIKTIEDNVHRPHKSLKMKLESTYTNELILGICTHIGANRDIVVNILKKKLIEVYNYEVNVIKLSDFITKYYNIEFKKDEGLTEGYSRLKYKIEGGDFLRNKYNSNSLLAELAIKQIREDRGLEINEDENILNNKYDEPNFKPRRICYIIDSLKNKEELEVLRTVYRDIFYLFSIYTPSEERLSNLIHKKNEEDEEEGLSKKEAKKIIDIDDYENIGDHGQNVRDTFIQADFFIRSTKSNIENTANGIERYLHLIFDTDIITPKTNETAMYFAKSAAGNSACLSRQVGATITDKNGVVVAQGWNDVPRFGGNLYGESDENSQKCHIRGYCMNDKQRNEIINSIIHELKKEIILDIPSSNKGSIMQINNPSEKKISNILEIVENIIKASRFKSIIEYSRSIHAEMHAIIIGSQMTGDKMVDGDLYCTTYPCHNCARHIVLAGIKNIYYIEPYKKSLCLTLHDDSITEDEKEINKVRLLPYDGVAPRRYLDFFSMIEDSRKNKKGQLKNIEFNIAVPKKRLSLQSIPSLEQQAIHALNICGILSSRK